MQCKSAILISGYVRRLRVPRAGGNYFTTGDSISESAGHMRVRSANIAPAGRSANGLPLDYIAVGKAGRKMNISCNGGKISGLLSEKGTLAYCDKTFPC